MVFVIITDSMHAKKKLSGSKNLLKWKGVMFGIDEADRTMTVNVQTPETTTTTSSEMDSSCATMIEINPIAADNAKDINSLDRIVFDDKTHEVTYDITFFLYGNTWKEKINISNRIIINYR